jgi:hypothetical protein
MAASGRVAHHVISPHLARFAALDLGGAERLAAIAGAIAAAAAKRHGSAQAHFLQQLQELTRPIAGVAAYTDHDASRPEHENAVAAGIATLVEGFDRLAEQLAAANVTPERSGAVEAVLLSRLLAGHRPHRVRLALLACAVALASPDYRPGDLVPVLPAERPGVAPVTVAPIADVARTGTFG